MTTVEQPTARTTAETVAEFFTRFGSGDRAAVLELFGPDTDWNVAGAPSVPWTGRRSSHEEIDAFLRSAQETVDTEQFDVERIIADGADAVALGSFTHAVRATGKKFVSSFALRVTVHNGVITRYHMFEDSHAAEQAFAA